MTSFSEHLPIWYQLTQTLRADILSGRRRPGERLDPETSMAQRHGISVAPVRQALRALEQEGLIVRRRGSGTFVSEQVRQPDRTITSLESLYTREFAIPARILTQGEVATPLQFAGYFPGLATLGYVRRLAFRDGRPWSYGTLYYPLAFAAELTVERLARYPLYRLFHEHYGIETVRSHFEVKAVAASVAVAEQLGIAPYSPALSLASVGFAAADAATGAFEMTFCGDPFVVQFETSHQPA